MEYKGLLKKLQKCKLNTVIIYLVRILRLILYQISTLATSQLEIEATAPFVQTTSKRVIGSFQHLAKVCYYFDCS